MNSKCIMGKIIFHDGESPPSPPPPPPHPQYAWPKMCTHVDKQRVQHQRDNAQ